MNTRTILTALPAMLFLAGICGVLAQRNQLIALREQQTLLGGTNVPKAELPDTASETPAAVVSQEVPRELLQLRNEVSRLEQRKRELSSVSKENEELKRQAASAVSGTNSGVFIRKATSQSVGFATPQNTLQTFLWSIQHRDFDTLLQCMTTESRQSILKPTLNGGSIDSFWKASEVIPGFQILGQKSTSPTTAELEVGMPGNERNTIQMKFQLVGGAWQMTYP